MRPLRHLPVWLVVRLCTDDSTIADFWNDIDKVLELNMDVLDDMASEAKEIEAHNSWLTYGEPLHRLREFGVTVKEFDLLDEAPLPFEQLRKVCQIM
jgi:hypothetical protein